MDPLSISVGCVSLVTALGRVSLSITQFVREARYTRHDLESLSDELNSLRGVLEWLAEDAEKPTFKNFPQTLVVQIKEILEKCSRIFEQIEETLSKYRKDNTKAKILWAASGKNDVA